jgi:hypothetical protein
MDPRELRKLYNHSAWPSPYAKLVAIKKKLDFDENGQKIKRLTHEQALNLLAKKARLSLDDFLNLEIKDALEKLGCFSYLNGKKYVACPLRTIYYNKYY